MARKSYNIKLARDERERLARLARTLGITDADAARFAIKLAYDLNCPKRDDSVLTLDTEGLA